MGSITDLFDPDCVAVVGATEREKSTGRAIFSNLDAGFDGELVPVNPTRDEVFGVECYPSLADVPGEVDLAVVVVPAEAAVQVVEEGASVGVENFVVISAGFSETGAEGTEREHRLITVADEHDLTLVGPNSLGIVSTPNGLNATFAEQMAPTGSISFLSQSGAFIVAALDWAASRQIGFKDVVSLGNEAVLDEVDFVQAWGDDPQTEVVLGYVEDIEDGRRFIDTAREVGRDTPLVVLKSGRSEAGSRAVASHTGSLAGSDRAYEAAFRQAGVIRADSVQELFDFGQVLAGNRVPSNDSVGVLTNAGGPGVLAADAVEKSGLSLASLSEDTRAELEGIVPENATVRNPLDIIGDAGVDRFRQVLEVLLADDAVGSLVLIACPTALFDFGDLAAVVGELSADSETPIVACFMGGEEAATAAERLTDHGIPNFFDPARAVESLSVLADYREIRTREYPEPERFDVDHERARAVVDAAADRGQTQLGAEAMEILDAYGISTPEGELVESPGAAEAIAETLGDSVVMKIVSPDIVHKSDIGGVEVGVPVDEVADVYETLVERAKEYDPDARVHGVLVQELVETSEGVEVIAGMNRDPQFGPLIMFGLGGVFVEVLEDVSFRVAPLSEPDARDLTEEIRSAPMLRGARGREPVDLDAVVEALQRLSQLAVDFPEIVEFDVNPLVAHPDGVIAVDLRLTLEGVTDGPE